MARPGQAIIFFWDSYVITAVRDRVFFLTDTAFCILSVIHLEPFRSTPQWGSSQKCYCIHSKVCEHHKRACHLLQPPSKAYEICANTVNLRWFSSLANKTFLDLFSLRLSYQLLSPHVQAVTSHVWHNASSVNITSTHRASWY